jgi:hypothetical protein
MPTYGPNSPATVNTTAGGFSQAWTNPSNVTASDNTYATASGSCGQSTHYLDVTNFSFSLGAFDTVVGIKVEVEAKAANSFDWSYSTVQLIQGGTATGNNGVFFLGSVQTTDTYETFGSNSDLWGLTWSYTDVNASNFGVRVNFQDQCNSSGTLSVDHVRITVYTTSNIPNYFDSLRYRKPSVGSQVKTGHPLARNLLGCWPFAEGSGGMITDISRGNNGALTNMDPTTDWASQKDFGYMLDFDASDDYINCGGSEAMQVRTSQMSISAWINIRTSNSFSAICSKGDGNSYLFQLSNNGGRSLRYYNGSTYDDSATIPYDRVMHVAMTITPAGILKFYIDGVVSDTHTGVGINQSTHEFHIGGIGTSGAHLFPGKIGYVAVWDRALTAEEIYTNYSSPYDFVQPTSQRWVRQFVSAGGGGSTGVWTLFDLGL